MSTPTSLPRRSRPTPAITADDVLRTFNTWAFKREQPSNEPLLRAVTGVAVEKSAQLPFVLYWGKGPRDVAAQPEVDCLRFLARMAARIATVHAAGAAIDLVFTDTHARLNGHSEARLERYVASVQVLADEHGFVGHRLSSICEPFMADPPPSEPIPAGMRDALEKCAIKWFRGEGSPAEGAQRYFDLNMIEKRAIEATFPQAVFVTFNNSEFRPLFPDHMPIFYMHSLRRGTAVKPWFLPAPPLAAAQPAA
jgi:hypothetical protein